MSSTRRESVESEKQYTPNASRAQSSIHIPADLAKQDDDFDGAPLEISPSHLSQPSHPLVPDGGLVAWIQVLSGFMIFFNSWGLINAFGVFQTYYKSTLIPNESDSNISWIGSMEAFLLCCTTIFAGPAFDRGYARALVLSGSGLVVFGLMMTSLCKTYWQLMLAQGLCVGVGQGCLFIVSIAIVPSYFSTKRSFAMGLASSGSSLGGVVYTIVFHRIVDSIGFGWATRIMAFIALATLIIPCCGIRMRSMPTAQKKKQKIIDFAAFKELPFTLFSLASFVGFIGLYVPFFYISSFASEKAGLDSTMAFYMLPILSAGSVAGRILPGFTADFLGPLNVLSTCTIIAGVLGFCWIAISIHATVGGLVIWSLLYGLFSGAFVSLQPSTVVSITDDMSTVGGRLGMNTFCAALGLLIGTPIAGVILQADLSWVGLQGFCAATLLAGGSLVMVTRWSRVGCAVARKA